MRWAFGVGAAVFLLGCVNGDDSTGIPPGSLGGACLSNGTCNTGLTCALENGKGVCEQPDATVDALADQSTEDVTSNDAPNDAPLDVAEAGADACNQTLAPSNACANQNCLQAPNTACCPKTAQCVDAIGSCNGGQGPIWPCQNRTDCQSQPNTFCCVNISALSFDTCPPTGQLDLSSTSACQNSCGSEVALCSSSADCPQQAPTCVGVQVSPLQNTIGVCH